MGRKALPPRHLTAMRLDDAAGKFVDYLRSRLSPKTSTITAKRVILGMMLEHLGGDREVWSLTNADFSDTLTFIINPPSAEEVEARRAAGRHSRHGRTTKGSQNQARTTLLQFTYFCHDRGWLDVGVTMRRSEIVVSKKVAMNREKPRVRFSEDQFPALLNVAEARHMRLRIAVAFGLYYGRRVSEIVPLQWRHVRLDGQTRSIDFYNQKRGRDISLPLLPSMGAELRRYRQWIIEAHGPIQDDWYVVPARMPNGLILGAASRMRLKFDPTAWPLDPARQTNRESLGKDVRKILDTFGFESSDGTGYHTFRRSAAREVAQKHGIEVARVLLDHEHSATTELYVGAIDQFRMVAEMLGAETGAETERDANVIPFPRRESA